MALTYCEQCGRPSANPKAIYCKNCGAPLWLVEEEEAIPLKEPSHDAWHTGPGVPIAHGMPEGAATTQHTVYNSPPAPLSNGSAPVVARKEAASPTTARVCTQSPVTPQRMPPHKAPAATAPTSAVTFRRKRKRATHVWLVAVAGVVAIALLTVAVFVFKQIDTARPAVASAPASASASTVYSGANSDVRLSPWEQLANQNANFASASTTAMVALCADGMMAVYHPQASGEGSHEPYPAPDWADVISVARTDAYSYALRSDGTVSRWREDRNDFYSEDLAWCGIVSIDATPDCLIGIDLYGNFYNSGDIIPYDKEVWTDLAQVSLCRYHMVGIRRDGSLIAAHIEGAISQQVACDVSLWQSVVSVDTGVDHTVGLCADGSVLAAGIGEQCQTSEWRNITSVAAGDFHTVGLCSDGTAVAAGDNTYGQCNVGGWTDLISITTGPNVTMGLQSDGTMLCTGAPGGDAAEAAVWHGISTDAAEYQRTNMLSQMPAAQAVSAVNGNAAQHEAASSELPRIKPVDVHHISCGRLHTVAVQTDGTVVATGSNEYGQCDVSGWNDIVSISAGAHHTVGLHSDGTVVAVGRNEIGQCNVDQWRNIVSVCAGGDLTIGLQADGKLVYTGDNDADPTSVGFWSPGNVHAMAVGPSHTVIMQDGDTDDMLVLCFGYNREGECDNRTGYFVGVAAGWSHTLIVDEDGDVTAFGYDVAGQCRRAAEWKDIVQVAAGRYISFGLRKDGTVVYACSIPDDCARCETWTDVVEIAAGQFFVVGIRADGTVVAAGDNQSGQCNTGRWSGIQT